VNEVVDCSISQIIANLVTHLDPDTYTWHLGGASNVDTMAPTFKSLGVQVVSFAGGPVRLARGVRAYLRKHEIDLVHTHTVRTRLVTGAAMAGMNHIPHLTTEHLLYRRGDRRGSLIYTLLDRISLYLPDHVVTVSEEMHREVAALPLMSAKRVTAIQNAVDCDAFYLPGEREACRRELGVRPDAYLIGYTGRITTVKGLDTLIQAFADVVRQYPRARLVIVGEGAERPALAALVEELGISDAVLWTGFRQDIPCLLAAMDAFVQPSSNEGLSLSILEAMAAAKPVVVTDVGGAREVVSDQETGLLVEPGSVDGLSRAMSSLLADASYGTTIGLAARESVSRRFGVGRMAAEYGAVYANLVVLPGTQSKVPQEDLVERA
jgi:glycosyltransferase involved in cell wall biosynthesis